MRQPYNSSTNFRRRALVEHRRRPHAYDIDPAPLARLVAAWCGIHSHPDDPVARMRAIANDDHDGPIHLIHLLAATEYATRKTGGTLLRFTDPLHAMISEGGIAHLTRCLHEGGFPAATKVARALTPEQRTAVLDALSGIWLAPFLGLVIDLTDTMIQSTTSGPTPT